MDVFMIVLRLIHIFSSVFWAGTTFFLVSFLIPVVRASLPEGAKVMLNLARSKFSAMMSVLAVLAVVSGLIMYWLDSGGLQGAWITTGTGLGFTAGGIMGLVALVIGFFLTRPATQGIAQIGTQIAQSGKPPTPEQAAQMGQLQMKLASAGYWTAVFLALALIGMATARYLR